jgi:hypothetical protein
MEFSFSLSRHTDNVFFVRNSTYLLDLDNHSLQMDPVRGQTDTIPCSQQSDCRKADETAVQASANAAV